MSFMPYSHNFFSSPASLARILQNNYYIFFKASGQMKNLFFNQKYLIFASIIVTANYPAKILSIKFLI